MCTKRFLTNVVEVSITNLKKTCHNISDVMACFDCACVAMSICHLLNAKAHLMYAKAMLWEYEFYGIFEKHSLTNMALRAYLMGTRKVYQVAVNQYYLTFNHL